MRKVFLGMCVGLLALSFMACGGPPPLSEIEANLNSPSATLSGPMVKSAFLNYDQGVLAAKMPGLADFGKLTAFLKVGEPRTTAAVPMKQYLLQSGIPSNIADVLMPYLPVKDDLSLRKEFVDNGEFSTLKQALPLTGCADGVGANVGLLGGSFRVSIDLACAGVGSGRVVIQGHVDVGIKGTQFRFEVAFEKACDKAGNCLEGAMNYKLGISLEDHNAAGGMLMSMRFRAKLASGETAEIKQGMRIHFDTAQKAGRIEALAYVKDLQDREATVVLVLQASGSSGSFSVKGANGEFSCKTQDAGKTGQCFAQGTQGQATYSW